MTVDSLIKDINVIKVVGDSSVAITGVQTDSRAVEQGNLFVAVCGVNVDAHRFIPDVVARGAAAVVCSTLPEEIKSEVCYILVADTSSALGFIASAWWGYPSRHLTLVGVTGTNGKTTTATLLYSLVRHLGYKAGLLSTVCNYVDDLPVPATQTTPDPLTINRLMAQMVEAGCKYAFMEVSSHAADQRRIDGLEFDGALFTNLTRDHLDYHKTVDNYLKAKKRFFDILPASAFALVNIDDKAGRVMLQNTRASRHTYSLREMSDFRGKVIESRLDGTLLEINRSEIEVRFTGLFNAYNLLAVYGAAILMGLPEEDVKVKMILLVPVAGRFQTLHSPKGYTAIVDYAHTPDAVENVLSTINEIRTRNETLITVIGAGGNRDADKRPKMAAAAVRQSDKVIITSDNPRYEDADDIIAQMKAGVDPSSYHKVLCISDRREAIRTAVALAKNGDIILVAGKGHETYQEINGVRHHFDDREELLNAYNEK